MLRSDCTDPVLSGSTLRWQTVHLNNKYGDASKANGEVRGLEMHGNSVLFVPQRGLKNVQTDAQTLLFLRGGRPWLTMATYLVLGNVACNLF